MSFAVSLSGASRKAVTASFATSNGTATAGSDYLASSGSIRFQRGQTTAVINVAVIGDTAAEPDETFFVTLSNPSQATIARGVATGVILNNDNAPSPTLSIADTSVVEGDAGTSPLPFTVTLSRAYSSPVTVSYATSNGSAAAGSDYTAAAGTLTFAAGQVAQIINVGVLGDTAVEPAETVIMTLSNPSGATLARAAAVGTITNDDVAPTLSIADTSVVEGDAGTSPLPFTVTLSRAYSSPVTVSYATSNGSAAAGSDYTAAAGTLTFAAGQVAQIINVGVLGDTAVEPAETVIMTLSNPSGATLARAAAVGTITNDDGTLTLSIADTSVVEGNAGTSPLPFTVTLSRAYSSPVTVSYATSNGSATAGSDYTATSGTLTFAAGQVAQTVNVGVLGDTAVEPAETVVMTLSNPSGATLARAVAIGTITNDDATIRQWGSAFYSPYVGMYNWPTPNLMQLAQGDGTSLLNLGYIQADSEGAPSWGGYSPLQLDSTDSQAVAINQSIVDFRNSGGDVMVSFGGAVGTSLSKYYSDNNISAQLLANAYASVANYYGASHLDFAMQGVALSDPKVVALETQAIKLLQQSYPSTQVWLSLPVTPTGLSPDSLSAVTSALQAGVKPAGINIMAMDFGEAAAPTTGPNAKTMGDYVIQAGLSTYKQLAPLYEQYGLGYSWSQLGITPMIGVNDVTTEIFTVTDAQALENFAAAKGLGMLSMWSLPRDNPGTPGQVSETTSGLSDPAYSFSNIFDDYGIAPPPPQWGGQFYAPYVSMSNWPVPSLPQLAQAGGTLLMIAGFIQADATGSPSWGGYSLLQPDKANSQMVAINKSIADFRSAGGDVMLSFGGAVGSSLSKYYADNNISAQLLANTYASVAAIYGATHLDFDIQSTALSDPKAVALQIQAIKLLQQSKPSLEVWLTLPVTPTGLTGDSLGVVTKALQAGLKVAGIAIMTMDFGEVAAPTTGPNAKTMGAWVIQSGQATYSQLSALYAQYGLQYSWSQLGLTPMIGVNDVTTEVFTVADAQAVEDFARANGLGMLSMWSLLRDNPGTPGQVSDSTSGLSDPAYSFSNVFNDYGSVVI